MTIVDSEASETIIDCHQAEEFVSHDVVGEGSIWLGHFVRPAPTPSVIC